MDLLREDREAPQEQGERCSSLQRASEGVAGSLPAVDLSHPGAYLRRCRKQLGFSLREMTERTRIQGLDNIEGEQFDSLPPEPYLKGFVLEYARELGVRELEALANSYLDRYRHVATVS